MDAAPMAIQSAANLYKGIIEDVMANIGELFIDEGVDESVLVELQQTWETKLKASKAVDSLLLPSYCGKFSNFEFPDGYNPHINSLVHKPSSSSGSFIVRSNPNFAYQRQNNVQIKEEADSKSIPQLDGPGGVSDDEVEEIEEADDLPADDDDEFDDEHCEQAAFVDEGEPLNSGDDDMSNEDATELFEADNTIVCQFEKIIRNRNKWKFVFSDGIMNINRKDYVFNKMTGESQF